MIDLAPQLLLAAGDCGNASGFLPSLYDGLCSGTEVKITSAQDILVIIANVIRILTALAGALAVIFLIVGGIFYVTSAGDPAKVRKAKDIINQAIIGLVIVIAAYSIVTFIAGRF